MDVSWLDLAKWLLLAHLVLDYPLQGEFLGIGKTKYNFLLIVHCLMWSLGIEFVLSVFQLTTSWSFYWLFFGHLWMDWLKCRSILTKWCVTIWYKCFDRNHPLWLTDSLGLPLWIDQAWHLVQLAVFLL